MTIAPVLWIGLLALAAQGPRNVHQPGVDRAAGNAARSQQADKAEMRRVHQQFGNCVVKRRQKQAEAFLLHPEWKDDDFSNALEKLDMSDCLMDVAMGASDEIRMEFPGDTMRYAIAEPLVRTAYRLAPIADFKAVPPLLHSVYLVSDFAKMARRVKPEKLEEYKAGRRAAVFLSRYGECVVRTDPANSFALIMAEPGSAEDKARTAALTPALAGCLPNQRTISLDKLLVRGTIAFNYFRLADAARTAKSQPGVDR